MRIACIIAVGWIAGLAVQAQDGRGPGRGRPSAGFTVLDLNGDGILDAAEIEAAPRSLAKLDKNADGQITSDEVRQAMPQGRGRGGPGGGRGAGEGAGAPVNLVDETVKTLMAFDANGDGKLSRSELPERFQGIFDRGDENKDGFLTPEEIRKMAGAQAAPPDSGRPSGRGDGPRGEMNFIRMDAILSAVDADGNGVLSADEIRNAAQSIAKLDKNRDGKITREEAMPPTGQGRPF